MSGDAATLDTTAADRAIEGEGTAEQEWLAHPDLVAMRAVSHDELARWALRHRCIWIVSPHPDDEVLALGGTMARLSDAGARLAVVSVTDGAASHPGSRRWTPERLAAARPAELQCALDTLGIAAQVHRLGLPDGDVARRRADLLAFLCANVEADDLLLAPWRLDGHPDHEATTRATLQAADDVGATVVEYPVWMWHWAGCGEHSIPWRRARRIALDASVVARKQRAIDQFVSQVTADERVAPVLPAHVLRRFVRPFEVVFC